MLNKKCIKIVDFFGRETSDFIAENDLQQVLCEVAWMICWVTTLSFVWLLLLQTHDVCPKISDGKIFGGEEVPD